jgi:NAD(P)-dependent dehydrogenase (short-subunit alcohol dehydrogenase family)
MRKVMNVNVFGHVAMTKTFLPFLITKRDSRVVNICSVAGYLRAPGMASYCCSKYALESFSDCLRRKMAVWSLSVSTIETGFMKTLIVEEHDKSLRILWNELANDVKDHWDEEFYKFSVEHFISHGSMGRAENPRKVVKVLCTRCNEY